MTTTYDPTDPRYFDPAALHEEVDRVFDLCHGCRLCFNLCPSFPTLFDFIDARDGDAAALTEVERDQVVDECYQCKLCYVKCPYVPPHEWELDFPRLMMRVHAVRKRQGGALREGARDRPGPRPHRPDGNGLDCCGPGGQLGSPGRRARRVRKVMEKNGRPRAERLLPPYARQRFSTWFRRRGPTGRSAPGAAQGTVSVFPTCFVEYMNPATSARTWSRSTSATGCPAPCPRGPSAAARHGCISGNVEQFTKAATHNVAVLAAEVRAGREVVVAQPTCAYVVRKDYPIYLAGTASAADAELVGAHTADPAEYLVAADRADAGRPSTLRFAGPGRPTAPCPTM